MRDPTQVRCAQAHVLRAESCANPLGSQLPGLSMRVVLCRLDFAHVLAGYLSAVLASGAESSGDVTRGPDKMGVPTTSQDRELSTDEGGLVRTLSEAACAPPGPFVGPDARMTLGSRSRGVCDSFHSSTIALHAACGRSAWPLAAPRSAFTCSCVGRPNPKNGTVGGITRRVRERALPLPQS